MTQTHTVVIEFERASTNDVDAFVDDLNAVPGVDVTGLSDRSSQLLLDLLVNLVAGSIIAVTGKLVRRFGGRAVTIRIKRRDKRELAIDCSDHLDPDALALLIRKFLED